MNRRNFFKGAVSVMAMAAILKGRVDSGGFFVAMYEPETETWRDRTVFAITNPGSDQWPIKPYRMFFDNGHMHIETIEPEDMYKPVEDWV